MCSFKLYSYGSVYVSLDHDLYVALLGNHKVRKDICFMVNEDKCLHLFTCICLFFDIVDLCTSFKNVVNLYFCMIFTAFQIRNIFNSLTKDA